MLDIEKIFNRYPGKIDIKKISKIFRINHLYVYINANCNLKCKYCNSYLLDKFLKSKLLTEKKFKSALKKFLSVCENPEITFYGGEPMLYKDRLIEFAKIIIKLKKNARINIFTNGTLLDDKIINFIKENHINLLISIDGNRETHNSNKIFKSRELPTYDIIVDRIKKANIFDSMTANMVITSKNVKDLSKNIKHLIKIGFVSINWDIDYDDNWEREDIKILVSEINKAFLNYLNDIKAKKKKYILSNLYKFKKNKKIKNIPIFLLNDGNFYLNEAAAILENMNRKNKDFRDINKLTKNGYLLNFYSYLKGNDIKDLRHKYRMFKELSGVYEREMSKIWERFSKIENIKKIYE
jgi:sulfatase maturation enzyme AslB (radical SAM superfamily)